MHGVRFRKLSGSRWVSLGSSRMALMVCMVLGLGSLTRFVFGDTAQSSYTMSGLSRVGVIVRGLIAVLLRLLSGRSAAEILAFDAQAAFGRLGLASHLSAQRSNGLASMIDRIRRDATALGQAKP